MKDDNNFVKKVEDERIKSPQGLHTLEWKILEDFAIEFEILRSEVKRYNEQNKIIANCIIELKERIYILENK
jgi:hypothetical protein